MTKPKKGDTVFVHYTGTLGEGEEFDSSRDGDPLRFEFGSEQVIPGFEKAVGSLEPGESTSITIEPEDAYGPRREDLVIEVSRAQIPPGLDPQKGLELELTLDNGDRVPVSVTKVGEDSITLDANHPLAGKRLQFDIELVKIEKGRGDVSDQA